MIIGGHESGPIIKKELMGKNSGVNLDISNLSVGFSLGGGTTKRTATFNGLGDTTFTQGFVGAGTYTFPNRAADTLIGFADYTAKGVILVGTGAGTFTPLTIGTDNFVLTADSSQTSGVKWALISAGDVVGPASAVNNDIAVFDTTTGKLIKDGGKTIAQIAPLTTKGDLYGFASAPVRVPVGPDGYNLTADSTNANGVSWQPSGAPQSVIFNPGKILTLVDDFMGAMHPYDTTPQQDILGQLLWQTYGGQYSQTVGTKANPGLVTPTNGAFASISLDDQSNTASIATGSGQISVNFVSALTTLSAIGNRYTFYSGLGISFSTNGIYFSYSDNVNSGNWVLHCTKAAVTTSVNSSIPAVTGFTNLGIVINAAGTLVTFYVNGIVAGTISTDIPTAAISPFNSFVRSSGALPAALLDLFYMTTNLTSSRSGGVVIPVGTPVVQNYIQTPTNYQVLITDAIVGVSDTSLARTITMPNANMATGQVWTIKDESLAAATNNITISGNGTNIDGEPTYLINNNGGSVDIYFNGSNFYVI